MAEDSGGMTVKEAAKVLNYETMTVYIKIQRQQIVPRRYGRSVRIFKEDNAELFQQRAELMASAQ